MAFTTTAKPLTSHSSSSLNFIFSTSSPKPSFSLVKRSFSSSLRTTQRSNNRSYTSPKTPPSTNNDNPKRSRYPWVDRKSPRKPSNSSPKSRDSCNSWINKWPNEKNNVELPERKLIGGNDGDDDKVEVKYFDGSHGSSAIDRIVLRLRNLGLDSDDDEKAKEEDENGLDGGTNSMPVTGEEKLGDLLMRDWVRPDTMLVEDDEGDDTVLPWERGEKNAVGVGKREDVQVKKRSVRAPTLADLTIEETELKRLRRDGMTLKDKINVAKAGVTLAVVAKIHDKWRKEELVRLKFHESLAHDMKIGHQLVERRTGGLVLWRSGSVMVVYRGQNYKGPPSIPDTVNEDTADKDISSANSALTSDGDDSGSLLQNSKPPVMIPNYGDSVNEEEIQFNKLLDGLGPRFVDWWGTGVLPVDADQLPMTIPGYKTPFRLLPTGMRSRLSNAEMTDLRKLAKSLPCHFALGRNRHHQGLSAAIVKLWEKSLVVKIAVKRGIQNTNNKLMADEIKDQTGGVLLLRNKFYIVMYRGKDFIPTSVAAALAEREELTKEIQNVEEKVRSPIKVAASSSGPIKEAASSSGLVEGKPLAGTLAEFYEAQARWGKEISAEERKKMVEEASRAKTAKVVKRIEHKLALAQSKKLRAEGLLAKIQASMVPVGPSDDQETITNEERFMFRRVGLKMKAYLPLGIRGVFDGVIENMHLHWKHRELVKLISKQKTLSFVEDSARLLEYESGGILVAIERVPKGYALIYYRGKNYSRPISIRPRNLLTKAKALKQSVAMQRHEALSQHIEELEETIEKMKVEMGDIGTKGVADENSLGTEDQGEDDDNVSESEEDEESLWDSDNEEDQADSDWDENEDNET